MVSRSKYNLRCVDLPVYVLCSGAKQLVELILCTHLRSWDPASNIHCLSLMADGWLIVRANYHHYSLCSCSILAHFSVRQFYKRRCQISSNWLHLTEIRVCGIPNVSEFDKFCFLKKFDDLRLLNRFFALFWTDFYYFYIKNLTSHTFSNKISYPESIQIFAWRFRASCNNVCHWFPQRTWE